MNVNRISKDGLDKILHNRVLAPVTCVIKFYSNNCHLCHALQEYYVNIADRYEMDQSIVFYAFNIDDDESISKVLKFEGVPTIVVVNPSPRESPKAMSSYKVLPEPEKPNDKTWYKVSDIVKFIEKEKITQ